MMLAALLPLAFVRALAAQPAVRFPLRTRLVTGVLLRFRHLGQTESRRHTGERAWEQRNTKAAQYLSPGRSSADEAAGKRIELVHLHD